MAQHDRPGHPQGGHAPQQQNDPYNPYTRHDPQDEGGGRRPQGIGGWYRGDDTPGSAGQGNAWRINGPSGPWGNPGAQGYQGYQGYPGARERAPDESHHGLASSQPFHRARGAGDWGRYEGEGSPGGLQGCGEGGWSGQHGSEQERFDPDYHQWRQEQMRSLDDDYRQFRQDRYRRFSDEFSTWRSSRHPQAGQHDSPQDNPLGATRSGASDTRQGKDKDKDR